jgi:hypothetical protein
MLPLESPIWVTLQHAYGSAEDIPALLREIAAEPADSRPSEGPWFDLWSALCHQGDVYPASFAAVPHLVQTLANHLDRACFDFFLLPASIEVARHRRGVTVPDYLDEDYRESLSRFPTLAGAAAGGPWDTTRCRSILAAIAVAKGQLDTAELLIEIDDWDASEVLQWYFSR